MALHQPFIKLRRARTHIDELEALFLTYLRETPPRVSTKLVSSPDGGWEVKFNFSSEPVPDEAGAVFGDAIHNIRAALDLAACECVRANGNSDKGVIFPFCEKAADLDKMIKDRKLLRASPAVVQYVQSLKPYAGGNAALRAIHDLDLRDKHRGMMPQPTSFASPAIEMLDKNGKPHAFPRIVGDPNTPADVKIVFPSDTIFANDEIIPTLHKLVALADSIVAALASIIESDALNATKSAP